MVLKKGNKDSLLERFIQAIRDAGIKLTHQRLEVCRELAGNRDHPDVETIYKRVKKRLPTISLDTVYRTFSMLEREKVLNSVSPFCGRGRFDVNTSPHHHFVCRSCGKVHDFKCDEVDKMKIPEEVLELGKVKQAYLELRGICKDCSSAK